MKFFFLCFILFMTSCSSPSKSEFKRRNLGEYYLSSGVVRYFLPELPAWANFSESGKCRRGGTTRFFQFLELRKSFSLSYEQVVHFQHMFNIENNEILSSVSQIDYIPLKEEENLFYSISDKTQAGIRVFVKPKFKRVHLVWIDHVLNDKRQLKKLKRLLNSDRMQKGHPVFVSLCLNQMQMKDFLVEHKIDNMNIRLIPFELFSPYDLEGNLGTNFRLYFENIFRTDQKLHFFLPEKQLPLEFIGNFTIHKI